MKVILLQDVEDLGSKYEVKEVKDGYARNFLLPKKMVKLATKKELKWLESQKEMIEKEAEENLKKSQELASRLDGLEIEITMKTGEHQELFESIDKQRILKELKNLGFEVKKNQVNLEKPIKELGEYPIKLNLDFNLEAEIKLMVLSEAEGEKEEEL